MDTISFLPAQPEDHEALKRMAIAFYDEDSDGFGGSVMTEASMQLTIDRAAAFPEQLSLSVFKDGDQCVGYCLLPQFWSNEYSGLVTIIDELYVIPSHRGKGISTRFIRSIEASGRQVLLQLEVFHENSQARELYKRLGFTAIDRIFMNKHV